MSAFTSDFDRGRAGYSPDHVDALVWALSELMVEPVAGGGLIEWTRLEAERLNAPRNDLNDTTGFVRMQAPANCSYVLLMSGRGMPVSPDGILSMTPDARRCWASDGSELSLTWLSSVKRGRCRAMSDVGGKAEIFCSFGVFRN
jgi:hypothetical protein